MILIQRRFLTYKEFETTDKGLKIISRILASTSNSFIPYENIGNKILRKKESVYSLLILAGFTLFLSLSRILGMIMGKGDSGAVFFWLLISVFFLFMYSFARKTFITLIGIENIEFLADRKLKEVEDFIETLLNLRDQYLNSKDKKTESDNR